MNKDEARAVWGKVRERIAAKKKQTIRAIYGYEVTKGDKTYHRPGVMDRANKIFLDAVQATYGKDTHRVARAGIEETAKINVELDEMMNEQMQVIDLIPQNQKRREWQLFLDNEYLKKMRDLYNNNTKKMAELYTTITGQKPPSKKQAPVVEVGKKPPAEGEAPPTGGEPTPPPTGPETLLSRQI